MVGKFTVVIIRIRNTMGEILKKRLKMSKFESPQHEAILGLLVAASHLRSQLEKVTAPTGISPEQYNILRILKGIYPNGHSCGEIGNRMLDRSPDITRRIDALLKQGLVERARSDEDRRVVFTKITKKGLDLLTKIHPIFNLSELTPSKVLSNKDCEDLARICEKLIEEDMCG
jgi:DNA-binding MarR family transcriptional regulator